MNILFTLFILSIYTVKPDKPNAFDAFQAQLKTVETHQKQYLAIKNELKKNYSWQKYNAELKAHYEVWNKEKTLKQSIGILQTLSCSSMLKAIKKLESSSITPYLKKELGLMLHQQFGETILSHDATRNVLNKLLLYDDLAHEQEWINAMIIQAP